MDESAALAPEPVCELHGLYTCPNKAIRHARARAAVRGAPRAVLRIPIQRGEEYPGRYYFMRATAAVLRSVELVLVVQPEGGA